VLGTGSLTITDSIEGTFVKADGVFLLHPAWKITRAEADYLVVEHCDVGSVSVEAKGCRLESERATWHPRFGVTIPSMRLIGHQEGRRASYIIRW